MDDCSLFNFDLSLPSLQFTWPDLANFFKLCLLVLLKVIWLCRNNRFEEIVLK